ncbi:MAG: flavodoxin family protein [Clostridia bacterium]|nr:flavodoxin family protein [Clostridia bacterium]
MKILMINGSPHAQGNTARALEEMKQIFEREGIEIEYVHVGGRDIRGCTGCSACFKTKKCVIDDIVNELASVFEECDGMVVGSPVYYAAPNGALLAFLNRLFYSTKFDKRMKVGAGIVVARRGGCTASFDVLNKYFTISGMPVASSQYWNIAHGALPSQVEEDAEGLQTMRTLANNMVFLMKSIALGKEKYGLPETEKPARTNFVR